MSDLKRKAKESMNEMENILKEVDVDMIKTEGVSIRAGNRILKLTVSEDQEMTVEDECRNEYREKIATRLQEIKSRLNSKITEMVEFTSQVREEAEKKERELKRQLQRAVSMPNVLFKHAQSGLSVVKGGSKGNLIWLFQGVYKPLFVNNNRIEPRYAKKLITPIIIMIKTEDNYVKRVSTHKPVGLNYFSHYHQTNSGPDCWGNWSHPSNWRKPEDIIHIARQAEAVLEKVNTGSVANSSPHGLPRLDILKKHLLKSTAKKSKKEKLGTDMERMGVGSANSNRLGDVWET